MPIKVKTIVSLDSFGAMSDYVIKKKLSLKKDVTRVQVLSGEMSWARSREKLLSITDHGDGYKITRYNWHNGSTADSHLDYADLEPLIFILAELRPDLVKLQGVSRLKSANRKKSKKR